VEQLLRRPAPTTAHGIKTREKNRRHMR